MAHVAFHYALGLGLGTLAVLPVVGGRFIEGRPVSRPLGTLLVASHGLGLFAVVPNILRQAGAPEKLCSGWWMNLFLGHPLLDQVMTGGMLVGVGVILACSLLQYGVLLAALRGISRRPAGRFPTGP